MMGEKLESVSITAYGGREFYGRCSKLTISTLSESSIWGNKSWKEKKRKKEKKTGFENLDSFWGSLNRVGKIYNVRHAWTLKKLVRRAKEFTRATTMEECYTNRSQWGLTYSKF